MSAICRSPPPREPRLREHHHTIMPVLDHGSPQKPFVLLCASFPHGHFIPLRTIAAALVSRQYPVTFLTSSIHRRAVESLGAAFVATTGYAEQISHLEAEPEAPVEGAAAGTTGERVRPSENAQLAFTTETIFVRPIASQYADIQGILRTLQARDPIRPVILIYESYFFGALPLLLDPPTSDLKPTAILGIGIIPLPLSSPEIPVFGPGLDLDLSLEGKARNIADNERLRSVHLVKPQRIFEEIVGELGCKTRPPFLFDAAVTLASRFLQMCLPEVEYPRTDLPASISFAGGLFVVSRTGWSDRSEPVWWRHVLSSSRKHGGKSDIVFVTQGSAVLSYNDLLVPTITALANRPHTIVIAALGKRGATLPVDFIVPENAYVHDWVPFDTLLEIADVFVTNGGYGGFQYAIGHGVPMVIAGTGQDKAEVAARAEWAGVAVNLRTRTASVDAVGEAVDRVLGENDGGFGKRARDLMRKGRETDTFGIVAAVVEELASARV
jgi:UDP:flavonoid glycosyltransferase YjiC (YdhE family)